MVCAGIAAQATAQAKGAGMAKFDPNNQEPKRQFDSPYDWATYVANRDPVSKTHRIKGHAIAATRRRYLLGKPSCHLMIFQKVDGLWVERKLKDNIKSSDVSIFAGE
jgi:hypothetical protein